MSATYWEPEKFRGWRTTGGRGDNPVELREASQIAPAIEVLIGRVDVIYSQPTRF